MALVETLVITIGTAMAKSLLGIWLKEHPLADAASQSTLDLLKSKTSDLISARNGAREFEALGDKIAENLVPVFRNYELESNSYEAVAHEVATAISKAEISSELLAEISYDPTRLLEHIESQYPQGDALFSEVESSLYKRALDLTAQYTIDLSQNLPDYTAQNFTQILRRLDRFMEALDRILGDLEQLRRASETVSQDRKFANFERDYRALIVRKFDRVNLFGADVSRRSKRYQLSIAYVSLEVAHSGTEHIVREDVQAALSDSSHTAIIGEAGTGKTTLLYWLAINSAADTFHDQMYSWRNTVPFIIELRRYVDGLPAPEEFISKTAFEIADRMPDGWIHKVFDQGRALLLIDGLDEVPTPKRDDVFVWLENFVHVFRKARFVLTSRPAAYEAGALEHLGFREFQLAAMQRPQIELFVEFWHRAVLGDEELKSEREAGTIAERLLSKMRNNISLTRLATNPLLCAMLCALHYERHMQLPADRSELYEACISMLLERRDVEREIRLDQYPELTYRQRRVLLDDLAYWMMKNQFAEVSRSKALPRIERHLKSMQVASATVDPDRVISMLVERSGIIREPTPDSLDFIHRTFQEYMAASAANLEGDWGFLVGQAHDDQWQETIVLAAGFANREQADHLINALLQKGLDESELRHKFDLLAVSCLETAVQISSTVRSEVEKRIGSLIPPRNRGDLKPLAAAGELAVPRLVHKSEYTAQEAADCLKVLRMIGTRAALSVAAGYAEDRRGLVYDELQSFLMLVTPDDVEATAMSDALISFLADSVDDGRLHIDGVILDSLASLPFRRIEERLSSDIRDLYLNFRDSSYEHQLTIVSILPRLEAITIDGNVRNLRDLASLEELRQLKMLHYGMIRWPSFQDMYSLESLADLRLASTGSWPQLYELVDFPNLERLSIKVQGDAIFEFTELREICEVQRLRYLHIALIGHGCAWPDLAPLASLESLDTLVLSSTEELFEDSVLGFDELPALEKITINVTNADPKIEKLLFDLKISTKDSVVELNANWDKDSW